MYHFVYTTVNLINNKQYIGVHSTDNIDDGYLGSGKLLIRAIRKYGADNFKVINRVFFEYKEEAFIFERKIVNEQIVNDPNYYNLKQGGKGGKEKGHKCSDNLKKYISEINSGEGNFMYGKSHSDETKSKISKKRKGQRATDEVRKKMSDSRKGSGNSMYGKHHTEETKLIISNKQKGKRTKEDNHFYGKSHTAETKQRLSDIAKSRPKKKCKYCNKEFSLLNYNRWHGDNCKFKQ